MLTNKKKLPEVKFSDVFKNYGFTEILELKQSIDHLLSFLDKNIEVEEISSLLLLNADMSKMINDYIHSTGMIYSQNAF